MLYGGSNLASAADLRSGEIRVIFFSISVVNEGDNYADREGNNRTERAIKPFVIGRKAWLFSHTPRGTQASAILYSVIETAKANGLIPSEHVMTCLDELCQSAPDLEKDDKQGIV
ncbi:transposase [Xenorhabdus innexi]|uniref:Transposase n=3 Tax=Xenorhabdus innexi TaxID=290109 RepID=A0A2G0N3W6_9GAMM|nr:transposase [Xenorhabdus innexi]